MKKFVLVAILTIYICITPWSQAMKAEPDSIETINNRMIVLTSGLGVLTVSSYALLNELWYSDYPRSTFHFFNDNAEWLQMDKFGHATSSYCLGRMGRDAFRWAGANEKTALWLGGSFGFIYLTGIEIMDGFSTSWGFSPGDELANAIGSSLFIGQESLWNEQRLRLKFSYSPSEFAKCRPEVLGENSLQRVLKDYNGQTYWLSANLYSFMKNESKFPKWMNVAVGYGAHGMLGARGNDVDTYCDISTERYRQFYFSLDADLSKIKSKNRIVCAFKNVFGCIKVPFPTVEYSVEKGWVGHFVYF